MRQTRRKQVQPPEGPERAFGRALRKFRTARGLSQEQLALESGFDRTYVSLIERGLRSPSIRTLVGLAKCLELRPSEIVREMEDQ